MNTITILFAQTKAAATIEILALLLGSAIIGFVTAWLYYKSLSARKIKELKDENAELGRDNDKLKNDKRKMFNTNHDREREINVLNKEIQALRALHAEAVSETDEMTLKNKRTEQLLYEKDEALQNIAQRKHLLDYKSFGTAIADERDDLKMISGIGPFIEERLHALDIYTFRQISKFTRKDISTINVAIEYFSGRIDRDEWVAQAKELVHDAEKRAELLDRIRSRKTRIYYDRMGIAEKINEDDLTVIVGIGGWIKEKLNMLDIYTFLQISRFNTEDVEQVTEAIEYFPGRIERDEWIYQARELVRVEGNKANIHNRILERKQKRLFSWAVAAGKEEANNLTLIQGISMWMEERLNMLEIYSFEQISRFTNEDILAVSEILDIMPDRIVKEDWINQARSLVKKELKEELN